MAQLWSTLAVGPSLAAAKANSAMVVFFVEDGSEQSAEAITALETSFTAGSLPAGLVALRITHGSQESSQLAQIYAYTAVPAVIIVASTTGAVLDRLEGHAALFASRRIASLARKDGDGTGAALQSVGDIQVRLQRLREEKAAAAAEAAKASEVERRKQGQMLLEAKREREEAQLRRVAEEQRRERMAQAARHQAVKDQIERDRAERAARAKGTSLPTEPAAAKPAATPATPTTSTHTGVARIALRLPDGSTFKLELESENTIADLRRTLIEAHPELGPTVTLRLTYPVRVLAPEEDSLTLAQAGLQRAQIVVQTDGATAGARQVSNAAPGTTDTWWKWLNPLALIALILSLPPFSWLFRRGQQAPVARPAAATAATRASSAERRRFANVNDLNSARKKDDPRHSYNGNSVEYED